MVLSAFVSYVSFYIDCVFRLFTVYVCGTEGILVFLVIGLLSVYCNMNVK